MINYKIISVIIKYSSKSQQETSNMDGFILTRDISI